MLKIWKWILFFFNNLILNIGENIFFLQFIDSCNIEKNKYICKIRQHTDEYYIIYVANEYYTIYDQTNINQFSIVNKFCYRYDNNM